MKKIRFLITTAIFAAMGILVACHENIISVYDKVGISDYAKDLGLKEVAVNRDANSSEICYFVKENGDSITLIGNKDENGCVSNIYLMKYTNAAESFSARFDEQMRPILLTFKCVDITFDWQNEKTALVKAWDPETKTYISTIWNSEETYDTIMLKSRSFVIDNNDAKRNGEMKMLIKSRQTPRPFTRAISVDELDWQYCEFSVTQCDYPKDALTCIHLSNAKSNEYIEMLDYYKKISTGVYQYRIPPCSYPSKATNIELCTKIDWGLETLKTGLTWLAGFSSVADAIALACASTGLGVPPAAVLETLSKATIIGAATLTVFMDGVGGTGGLMKNLNPDWYYKEYVIADLVLSPTVLYPEYINCEDKVITPELSNITIHCDIDGEPTIDSFTLNPDFPSAGQGYVASATYHCVPIGSTITMSIVGTDGYKDSITSFIDEASGTAELYVPGAATGVKDVCKVEITPPNGETIVMSASLMFGF